MIPKIWYRWLHVALIAVMLFGISTVLFPGLIKQLFSALIYSDAGAIGTSFSESANRYIVLVHAVLGSVMFGWGAAMLLALRGPFSRGEKEGWLLITVSLAAWYIPDTVFSLYTGFWQNAVLNTSLVILLAVPLAASCRHFRGGGTDTTA